MSIGFITHPECALHDMGTGHPESPARLSAIQDQLLASGLEMALQYYDAPLATREQLCRVHDPAYVDGIFRIAPGDGLVYLDGDTLMGPHTLRAALRAAGAAILGVELVMDGKNNQTFCNIRPPGHHAERNRAMGFCIFNNVAVAAAYARQHYQLQRVAIVDFDVHHGNGTEDIFRGDSDILFCSTFQHPFYPHTGADTRQENIVNVPLPAGTDGRAFRDAVEQHWLPRLDDFKPELILVSAGFDGHVEDEMAGMVLVESDYAWVTRQIKQLAERYAKGRIVSTLEGGYALPALGRSVVAHLKAML